MNAKDVCRWIGIRMTPRERVATAYLEKHGQQFCVDFGYANAIEKAREHWRARKKRKRR